MSDKLPSPDDEWLCFVHNAIAGLTLASERLRADQDRYLEKRDWTRKKKAAIPRENSVSRALADLFNGIRSSQAIHASGPQDIDLRNIFAECEIPRVHDVGLSDMSNPTDFRLTLMKGGELDLRIEAKTVLTESEIRDDYLGKDGLQRFDDVTNPYTISSYGGMVAYVVDHDAALWRLRIAQNMDQAREPETLRLLDIGGAEHKISSHALTLRSGASHKVDVVHFVIEIDAVPSRRDSDQRPGELP